MKLTNETGTLYNILLYKNRTKGVSIAFISFKMLADRDKATILLLSSRPHALPD